MVRGLWDSWDEDAFVRDKESGRYFDPARLHILDHKGEHFSVRGPLNVPRPPQGHPVIVQAGSSDVGKELGARIAEVIFTAHQTLDSARKFYDDLKGRLAKYGRSPDDVKIMPGVSPFIGRTQEEADEKFATLQSLVHPEIGLALLGELLGNFDLTPYPLDGPLPEIKQSDSSQHVLKMFTDMAKNEKLTIRQLYQRIVLRGHWIVRGTAETVADQLEDWFSNGGCDGYNVMPPYLPGGLDDFVDQVIPELQRRGLFRREYEGKTLRDNLGLRRPANRFTETHMSGAAIGN